MRVIVRDYPRSLYLLNLKRPSSVFKQAPFFKEGFQYANT
ncbi:hypothetical protein OUS_0499 [Helicobacter pylori R056a]|uniref:Uncharacterized protein n=1 Tax=Helicobacter pylori R018c TaxID=1145110 RepID=K2K335_HELPX|nr:hypothetical protein OUC_0415 [Helicobacter pylori R018c]EKE95938.1 hypothetical protein OUS_0499 [Helicobacter pylori R056a]